MRVVRGRERGRLLRLHQPAAALAREVVVPAGRRKARDRHLRPDRVVGLGDLAEARDLQPRFVDPPAADDVGLRAGHAPVRARRVSAGALRHQPAERRVVAVERVGPLQAQRERARRPPVMVQPRHRLVGRVVERDVAALDGEPGIRQDRRRRRVDRHEVGGGRVAALDRREEERPVAAQRPSAGAADLPLGKRRLRLRDRRAERIEALEVIARVQRFVTEVRERRPGDRVAARPRDDVHHAARGVAELGRVRSGEHPEFADGLLAERAARAANHPVVVVQAVDEQAVGQRALAQHRQPRRLRARIGRSA